MCDCNGDGLATLSAFFFEQPKKLKFLRCMKMVFFGFGGSSKNEEV